MATRTIQLSRIARDPFVASAFARIEGDASSALVIADKPKPVLSGGAVRVLEAA
jgi:hypothetical protein